jgi:hypothetical protein
MKVVQFLRSHLMYQPGETAGFDDATAKVLIASGVAVDPDAKRADPQAETPDAVAVEIAGAGEQLAEGVHLVKGPAEAPSKKTKSARSSSKKG